MGSTISLIYLLAVVAAALGYRLAAPRIGRTGRPLLLAAISAGFLWHFLSLTVYLPYFAAFVAAATLLGLALFRGFRPWPLVAGIAGAVVTMVAFKYQHFVIALAGPATHLTALSAVEWIGLSYTTFRAVDMLLVLNSPLTKSFRIADAVAYLLFFPPFVSGPINRFGNFCKDMDLGPGPLDRATVRNGIYRLAWGVFKLVVLSRLAWYWSLPALPADLAGMGAGTALLGLYAYFAYIFFEFSGYCDVVIVVALLFGVKVPENFDNPFAARNIQDFWNRWHISLSQWCRDHIFFPLVRLFTRRLRWLPPLLGSAVAIIVTFAFIGVWHGDAMNWVIYGLYHGCGLAGWMAWREAADRLAPDRLDRWDASFAARTFSTVLTLNFVTWGLVLTLSPAHTQSLLAALGR